MSNSKNCFTRRRDTISDGIPDLLCHFGAKRNRIVTVVDDLGKLLGVRVVRATMALVPTWDVACPMVSAAAVGDRVELALLQICPLFIGDESRRLPADEKSTPLALYASISKFVTVRQLGVPQDECARLDAIDNTPLSVQVLVASGSASREVPLGPLVEVGDVSRHVLSRGADERSSPLWHVLKYELALDRMWELAADLLELDERLVTHRLHLGGVHVNVTLQTASSELEERVLLFRAVRFVAESADGVVLKSDISITAHVELHSGVQVGVALLGLRIQADGPHLFSARTAIRFCDASHIPCPIGGAAGGFHPGHDGVQVLQVQKQCWIVRLVELHKHQSVHPVLFFHFIRECRARVIQDGEVH